HGLDAEFVRTLIDKFAGFTGQQSWPFSYTDRIGNVCLALHEAIDDPLIRAALIECVMNVGIGHNRYHVMDIMDTLLLRISPGEDMAVADRVERGVRSVDIATAAARLGLEKLAPGVRRIFRAALDKHPI